VTIAHSDVERGTHDRRTNDGRPRVEYVPIRSLGIEVLAIPPPKEPVRLDEVAITPTKRWQKQEATQQAKQVLKQAKAGRPVADKDVAKLQQRLLTLERQDELAGRESEGRQLALELGELRRSKLVSDALDALARPKDKRRYSDAYVDRLQQRLLMMERQDELLGQDSEGRRLAVELGDVRRSRLVAEASDVLARAKEGRRFPAGYVTKLQQRLLSMESQDELAGRDSEGKQLAGALGELRRSQLVAEALNVVAKMKEGRRFSAEYVTKLQQLLGTMQRQDELAGRRSEGLDLAVELATAARTRKPPQ